GDGLQSAGAVDVGDRGDRRAALRPDREDLQHERNIVVLLKPVGDRFPQDRWRERPERFAALYLQVENILHVGATRIAQDRSVAKRPRPPFHPALKPADHKTIGDGPSVAADQRVFIFDTSDAAAFRGDRRAPIGEKSGYRLIAV